ncbi:hypothetical protein, partial [Stenotrophomonas maltophilia group sp. Smal17]|uniref:hypothetical protein n=1 Tax=Stenotrophomonas maltophilia group sp. Smal17 TaxID=3377167 RepID=UPI002553EF24
MHKKSPPDSGGLFSWAKNFSASIVSTKVDTRQSRNRDPIPCRPTVGIHRQQRETVEGGVGP